MKLSNEESLIYDEVYRKVFNEAWEDEYAYMKPRNPEHLSDIILEISRIGAVEAAENAAHKAIMEYRQKQSDYGETPELGYIFPDEARIKGRGNNEY